MDSKKDPIVAGKPPVQSGKPLEADKPTTRPPIPAQRFLPASNLDLHDPESKIHHHTDLFDEAEAQYRRGFPIDMKVHLAQKYDPEHHKISIIIANGSRPIVSKGTLVKLEVDQKEKVTQNGWELVRVPEKDFNGPEESCDLYIRITPPVTARIGAYRITVKTQVDENVPLVYQCKDDLYLLFNPWHKQDPVYMEKMEDINEYVLNTDGVIFVGSEAKTIGRRWHFGQFERGVPETALWLIEKAGLPTEYLNDPILVSRSLAAMINGADRGALEKYRRTESGLTSNQWAGTVSILNKLLQQKGAAVRFGSDWTFAAVYCSLNRALGIPCRVVTCYAAALDVDKRCLLDVHWSSHYSPINELNVDSSKIFHTWNEIWMKRPDIGTDMDGWQAIDCTPHTGAESLYRLGPAPVNAIGGAKNFVMYDTGIFASMANGCIVHWMLSENGDMKPLAFEANRVGTKIVTKAKGNYSPESVAESYKLKGDECCQVNEMVKDLIKKEEQDVVICITPPDDVQQGDTVTFTVQLENKKAENRTVELFTTIMYESYHEANRQMCKKIENKVYLNPSEKKLFNIKLRSDDYVPQLTGEVYLTAYILALTEETDQITVKTFNVNFEPYDVIRFSTQSIEVQKGRPFDLLINIGNPFRNPLSNCLLSIEGPGITKVIKLTRPIRPQEQMVYRYTSQLNRSGSFNFYVTFLSHELNANEAVQTVNVVEAIIEQP